MEIDEIYQNIHQNNFMNNKNKFSNKKNKNQNYNIKEFEISEHEKDQINTISNISKCMSCDDDVSYSYINNCIKRISSLGIDVKKQFLTSIFFPREDNQLIIGGINAFPLTTTKQFVIKPNSLGNFILQVVLPNFSGDETNSSIGYYVGDDLTGNDYISDNKELIYLKGSFPNIFNGFLIQSYKVSVSYTGRSDIMSGHFGAAINTFSSFEATKFFTSYTNFDKINDSLNARISDVSDGLNIIYTPANSDQLKMNPLNTDLIASKHINTGYLMNVYGLNLPSNQIHQSASIIINVQSNLNFTPKPNYMEILKSSKKFIHTEEALKIYEMVRQSSLLIFKHSEVNEIESLFYNVSFDIIKKLFNEYSHYENKQSKTILEFVKQYSNSKSKNFRISKEEIIKINNQNRKELLNDMDDEI
tara:strand:- start:4 stop:1254 length:1251 start_codon:yes stop_codon:yes gene_type:complete